MTQPCFVQQIDDRLQACVDPSNILGISSDTDSDQFIFPEQPSTGSTFLRPSRAFKIIWSVILVDGSQLDIFTRWVVATAATNTEELFALRQRKTGQTNTGQSLRIADADQADVRCHVRQDHCPRNHVWLGRFDIRVDIHLDDGFLGKVSKNVTAAHQNRPARFAVDDCRRSVVDRIPVLDSKTDA